MELENLENVICAEDQTPPPRRMPTPNDMLMLDPPEPPAVLQIEEVIGDGAVDAADGDAWVTPLSTPRLGADSEVPQEVN